VRELDSKIKKLNLLVREYNSLKAKEKRIKDQIDGVAKKYRRLKFEVDRLQAKYDETQCSPGFDLSLLSPELQREVLAELKNRGIQ
jgi:predicted nuclease with TOPRIM domain